jgi:hypothetical protein
LKALGTTLHDFTYTTSVKAIRIQDSGKGKKPVADDLEAVLRKGWHQGSVTGFLISYRDTHGTWHQISWDGKGSTEKEISSQP